MDGQTEGPSQRDAMTHPKTRPKQGLVKHFGRSGRGWALDKCDGWTNGTTDQRVATRRKTGRRKKKKTKEKEKEEQKRRRRGRGRFK